MKGYKEGDKFEVIDSNYAVNEGDIVELKWDDGSDCPYFIVKTGNKKGEELAIFWRRLKALPVRYNKGDIVKVIDAMATGFANDAIIKVLSDEGGSIKGKLVAGKYVLGYEYDDEWYIPNDRVVPVYHQEPAPYEPITIELNTLEEFETMKAIMHLHNKVSGSSFFKLDWTPEPSDVREFMQGTFKALDTHRKGWSKY